MAVDNGGITIPVSVVDNTQAGLKKVQSQIIDAISRVPTAFEFSADIDTAALKKALNDIKQGSTSAADSLEKVTNELSKTMRPKNAKNLAKELTGNIDSYFAGAKQLEAMLRKMRDLDKMTGGNFKLESVVSADGKKDRFKNLVDYANELNKALDFSTLKGNSPDQLAEALAARLAKIKDLVSKSKLVNEELKNLNQDVKFFKNGGNIASMLGMTDRGYKAQVTKVKKDEEKLQNDILSIVANARKTGASRLTELTSKLGGEKGFSERLSAINERQRQLSVDSNMTAESIKTLVTALSRLKSIEDKYASLKKQGLSDSVIKGIMQPMADYRQNINRFLKGGNINDLTTFIGTNQWGSARSSVDAAEKANKAIAGDLSKLNKENENLIKEMEKYSKSIDEFKRKYGKLATSDAGFQGAMKYFTSSWKTVSNMGNIPQEQRADAISVARSQFEYSKSLLESSKQSVAQQERDAQELVKRKEAADKAINGILKGVEGTDKRLGDFTSKGIDVVEYTSRLRSISEGLNTALNSNDLQQKTNAVNELGKALKQLQEDITIGTSKKLIDDKTQAAINSVNQQLTSFKINKIGNFSNTLDRYERNGMDVSAYRQELNSLKNVLNAALNETDLETKRQLLNNLNNALDGLKIRANGSFDKFTFDNRTAKNLDDATAAAKRYEAELDRVANAHKNNYSLVSQLGQEIAMVYSIQQVKQFLSSIVEIGGQFEQQRMAIGAILGDASKANVLFNQVKELGLHSNFSTLELDKYVKELSAFDIEYNQLFDKMKKLADISAGTGTDMSRIVLAYGHVKAAGYLEGMQRRQFTNANINIIDGLRKLYSKREGNRNVSPKEIYSRIKNKEVSYEDVDQVLMQMAEPGGKFYNMQEVMADTTKGVWKNVSDAWNHMLLAMNDSFGGVIKWIGNRAMELTRTLGNIAPAIVPIISSIALWKSASFLLTNGLSKENRETLNSIRTENRKRIANLELAASYRTLTEAEKEELAARKQGAVMYAANTLSDDSKKKDSLLNGIRTGRVGFKEAGQLWSSGKINQSDINTANKYFARTIYSANVVERTYSRAMYSITGFAKRIGDGLKYAAASMKSFIVASWPLLAIEATIGVVTYAWNKHQESLRKAQEVIESMKSSYNGLNDVVSKYEGVKADALTSDEVLEMEKELLTSLKDNIANYYDVVETIYQKDGEGNFLKGANDRADELLAKMKKIKDDLYKIEGADVKSAFDTATENTSAKTTYGDAFQHDLRGQIKNFSSSYSKLSKTVSSFNDEQQKAMIDFLSFLAQGNEKLNAFKDDSGKIMADKIMQTIQYFSATEQLKTNGISSIMNQNGTKNIGVDASIAEFVSRVKNIREQFKEAKDADWFPALFKNEADPSVFSQEWYNSIMGSFDNYSKDAAEYLSDLFSDMKFGVEVNPKMTVNTEELEKNQAWKDELISYFEGNEIFKSAIRPTADLSAARNAAQQAYESAFKKWNDIKASGKIFGIDINFDLNTSKLEDVDKNIDTQLNLEKAKRGMLIYDQNQVEARIKALEEIKQVIGAMILGNKGVKDGYLKDPNSKSNKSSSTKKEDPELVKMRDKVSALSKLLSTYKKLKKEWGETEALSRLTSADTEEGKTFRKYFKDNDISEKAIVEMLNKMLEEAKKKSKDEGWESVANNIASKLFDIKDETLKEKVDSIMQKMEDEFERRKGRINIYRSMLEATGNRDSAKQLAYFDGVQEDLDKINIWDSYSSAINDFNKEMEALKDLHHTKNGEAFTYEMLFGMTPEELASEEIPGAVRNLYDKVNKEVENGRNEQMQQFASVFSEYQSEMERIAAETDKISRYEGVLNAGVNAGWIDQDQANAMIERMKAKLNLDTIENSLSYSAFTSFTIPKYIKEIDLLAQSIKNGLKRAFDSGAISAKKYMEEIQKIREIERKNKEASSKSKKFIDFFNGKSMNDRIEERNERGKAEEDIGFEKYNEAKDQLKETDWYKNYGNKEALNKMLEHADAGNFEFLKDATSGTSAEMSANAMEMGQNMQTAGKGMQSGAESAKATMAIIDAIIHTINAIVQGVVETWKEIQQTKIALKGTTQLDDNGDIKNGSGKNRSFYNTMNSPDQNGFWNAFSQASQSATDGWDSFKNGDLLGVIKGVVGSWTKWFSGFAEAHDNRQQAIIDEQDRWLRQYERINTELELSIKRAFGTDLEDYSKQLDNLYNERTAITKQYEAEMDKKNKDSDSIQEYKERLAELDDTINNFAADLANTLYGIDFKGWASQLTDALTEAFENGEDAALKWEQTVGDIVRDLGNKIMEKYLEEQVFNQLYEKYFGVDENGHATGLIGDISKMGTEDMKDITRQLHSDLSSKVGDVLGWFQDFYNQIDDYSPYSSSSESSGGLSKIGQNLTEETGGVISGYINSLNGHVSAMRTIANKQMNTMDSIAEHTLRNAEAAERIDTALNQVMNGTKSIHIS